MSILRSASMRRCAVGTVAALAVVLPAAVAPATAAPVTVGCPAQTQPSLTLGSSEGVQVLVPTQPGWRIAEPQRGFAVVGSIESADGADGVTARVAFPKDQKNDLSNRDLERAFRPSEAGTVADVSTRTLAGPCGLPTVSTAFRFTDRATKRVAFGVNRYTLLKYGNTTAGVVLQATSFDRARLAEIERVSLSGYGIRIPS